MQHYPQHYYDTIHVWSPPHKQKCVFFEIIKISVSTPSNTDTAFPLQTFHHPHRLDSLPSATHSSMAPRRSLVRRTAADLASRVVLVSQLRVYLTQQVLRERTQQLPSQIQ